MTTAALRRSFVVSVALLAVLGLAIPHATHGAVICQKKKRVRLRPGPECKKKEQKVADTATLALGSQLTAVETGAGARLDALEKDVGLQCLKAATRNFAPKYVHTSAEALSAPFIRTDGCRALDGNPGQCNNAFQSGTGWNSAYIEATSCFYHAGRCWPCAYDWQESGACVNACDPPLCANAPSRTFVGGNFACGALKEQSPCEASFEGGSSAIREGRTCYWDPAGAGTCRPCSVNDEIDAKCTNGCAPLPTCSARSGKPVKFCSALAGQAACEAAFQVADDTGQGYPASCYWDAPGASCHTCSAYPQFQDRACTNACS